jgi:hypothetical protein
VTAVAGVPPASRRAAPTPVSRARIDASVRLGAVVALWLGLLLVTYWWTAGGGIQDLSSWTDGLTSTGRLTGLIAADLLPRSPAEPSRPRARPTVAPTSWTPARVGRRVGSPR